MYHNFCLHDYSTNCKLKIWSKCILDFPTASQSYLIKIVLIMFTSYSRHKSLLIAPMPSNVLEKNSEFKQTDI